MTEGVPGTGAGHGRAVRPQSLVGGGMCAVAGVTLLAVLFTVRGVTVGPADTTPGGVILTLGRAVWWLSPALCYWVRVRTLAGAGLIGLAYLGAAAWLLATVYTAQDSAAALGFLFLPSGLWLGVLLATDVDRALACWLYLRRRARGRGAGQAAVTGEGLGRWWQWLVPTGLALATLSLASSSVWPLLAAAGWSAAGAGLAVALRRLGQPA